MATRLDLHKKLVELLGSDNCYYQPPESKKLNYPCIIYSKSKIDFKNANNIKYLKNKEYSVIVVDKKPDNPVIEKLLELPYCSYDRHYEADGLNHDSLVLYY